ncbi:unnamed protein product [Gongylonema pulchrum]|uniref:Uncharacterized protein n=1 Tax=Gongylonema pulchrum TaxID=637853 RepID=A0A183EPZ1_9BILA|nr:unnamed protein product [Gongylonema pulchrum]
MTAFLEGRKNEESERSESPLSRKKINFFHGLHKVSESFKIRKGAVVSSLRQSFSQAAAMNEISSSKADEETDSSVAAATKRPEARTRTRLAESHSLDDLNTAAELNKQRANEILDKYRSKPEHDEATQEETTHFSLGNDQKEV